MATTPDDTLRTLIAFSAALIVLSTLVVALRVFARHISAARIWWDDGFILLSLLLSYASYVILYLDLRNDIGLHQQDVRQDQLVQQLKNVYASEIIYPLNITTIKTSIILLYLRLFGGKKRFRITARVTLFLVIAWCLSTVLPAAFRCIPISQSWSLTPNSTQCFNILSYLVATGILNVILDFWILVLPLPVIWALNLTNSRKAALSGIFLLGVFTCAASIIRVYAVATFDINDITYSSTAPTIWSNVEISVGIICTCLPMLRPLIPTITKAGAAISRQRREGRQYAKRRSATASGSRSRAWSSRNHHTVNVDVENGGPAAAKVAASSSDADLASRSMELPLLAPAPLPKAVVVGAFEEHYPSIEER